MGPDLQRRLPARSQDRQAEEGPRALGQRRRRMSPGGKYVLHFDETGRALAHLPRRRRRAREPHREASERKFQQENDTPDLPGAVRRRRLDRRRHVGAALRQVRHLGSEAGRQRRRATSPAAKGASSEITFRYRSLDPEERTVPANKPLLLSATDDRTRATGFYRVASLAATAAPEKVVMLDKAFGAVTKAKNADTVVFTLSRFEEFPDLWVSDTTFKDMKKVSNADPQQDAVRLGQVRADRVHQRRRQEAARDPDQAGELRSDEEVPADGLHLRGADAGAAQLRARRTSAPASTSRATSATATSCCGPTSSTRPAIRARAAEKCVIPAVNTVVAQGYIDPKRIGIQGHSWGGYQITHLITQTNLFAAVEAGASVSNMISAYGGIRWGTGMSRAVPVREDAEPHRRAAVGRAAAVHRELADLLGRRRSRRRT